MDKTEALPYVTLPNIQGTASGLYQYYELERQTDYYSCNTGKVMAKVGWNEAKDNIDPLPVIFVLVDNRPHLTALGVSNLIKRTEKLYIVTTSSEHPACKMNDVKLEVIKYQDQIDFKALFQFLKSKGSHKLTIQSGGEMNAVIFRAGMVNAVSVVVAPLLVGGRSTLTLIDGDSLETLEDLKKLKTLK